MKSLTPDRVFHQFVASWQESCGTTIARRGRLRRRSHAVEDIPRVTAAQRVADTPPPSRSDALAARPPRVRASSHGSAAAAGIDLDGGVGYAPKRQLAPAQRRKRRQNSQLHQASRTAPDQEDVPPRGLVIEGFRRVKTAEPGHSPLVAPQHHGGDAVGRLLDSPAAPPRRAAAAHDQATRARTTAANRPNRHRQLAGRIFNNQYDLSGRVARQTVTAGRADIGRSCC